MKSEILFYNTELCSGCLLCEMACSLMRTGECSRETSVIKVALHPYLSVPTVSYSLACNCPTGKEKCVDICNQKALMFVPRERATLKITEKDTWVPCPLYKHLG